MAPRLPTERAPLLAVLDGADLVKQGAEAVCHVSLRRA